MRNPFGDIAHFGLGLAAKLFITPYVEKYEREISGRLYRNLVLTREALRKLPLPLDIDVIEGHVAEVSIDLGYTTQIKINKLYLLVAPAPVDHSNPEERNLALAAKQKRLADAEALDPRTTQDQGFIGAFTGVIRSSINIVPGYTRISGGIQRAIMRNVQVIVNDVHIRHEDGSSCPTGPFATGITLANLTIDTKNDNWESVYVKDNSRGDHKLVSMDSLAVYLDPNGKSIAGLPSEESLTAYQSFIAISHRTPDCSYLLQPMGGEAKIILSNPVDKDTAAIDVAARFREVKLAMDSKQYRNLISMADAFNLIMQTKDRQYRPSPEVIPALNADPRQQRQDYQTLYTRKVFGQASNTNLKPLHSQELAEFNAYEAHFSYEELRDWRSQARAQHKETREVRVPEQEAIEELEDDPTPAFPGSYVFDTDIEATPQKMSEEQQREFFEFIEYDRPPVPEGLTANAPRFKVKAFLEKGSFSLQETIGGESGAHSELISVVGDAFQITLLQGVTTLETTFSLGSFSVYDDTCGGSLHRKIVRVKDEDTSIKSTPTVDAASLPTADPLLSIKLVQNPLDGHADSTAIVRMKALEIVYHRGYVEAVVAFFSPPKNQMESVSALLSTATETLDELWNQSRAALESALDKHKTLDITLDIEAPVIIVPENITSKTGPHLVFDAGHISIRSDLVPKSELSTVLTENGEKCTAENYANVMYDKFLVKVEAAQLVLGNDWDSCMASLKTNEKPFGLHLIEHTNLEFVVRSTIAPTAMNLTRFKVSGRLPALVVNFSNLKYKSLMGLIDISIPKYEDDGATTLVSLPTARPLTPHLSPRLSPAADYTIIEGHGHSTSGNENQSEQREDTMPLDVESADKDIIHQGLFEFAFKVDKLQASLSRSTATGGERPLADLLLDHFSLDFALTKFDMQVNLALRSFSVSMIDGSRRIPFVLSPEASTDPSVTTNATDLVQVKYSRVQSTSPEFMTVYEGIDQSIDVTLSTFVVHAAPEPILNLYDFVMSTFVAGHGTPEDAPLTQTPGRPSPPAPPSNIDSGKIRVRVTLTKFEVAVIDEETKLATLQLSAADVAIYLGGNTMRIDAHLGSLSLVDTSPIDAINPSFNRIISIDDDNLADFAYESFDSEERHTFPGYNSSLRIHLASLKMTFLEEPVRKLYLFLEKFARMKALYDTACLAATHKAAELTRTKFDIRIKSPVITMPSNASSSHGALVMEPGEIYANNAGPANTISARLDGIKLTSWLRDGDNPDLAELKIVDGANISSLIIQSGDIDRGVELERPDTAVHVKLSKVEIFLTQAQYIHLVRLFESIPRIFAPGPKMEAESQETCKSPAATSANSFATPQVKLAESTGLKVYTDSERVLPRWPAVVVTVAASAVCLEFFDQHATNEGMLENCGILRLSLNENIAGFKMMSDGASESRLNTKSFTIHNTKAGDSRFREIISTAQHDKNQIEVVYTTSSGVVPSSSATVTVNASHTILTIDPVLSLLDLLQSPFTVPLPGQEMDNTPSPRSPMEALTSDPLAHQSPLSFQVNVHNVSISIVEKYDDPNTQAIRLGIKEITLSRKEISSLAITGLNISLVSMNKPADKVSILEEVDMTFNVDCRPNSGRLTTKVTISSQPIILRVSLRDIYVITAITTKAMELPSGDWSEKSGETAGLQARRSPERGRLSISSLPQFFEPLLPGQTATHELFTATLKGFRLVLIEGTHESPMLQWVVKPFTVNAQGWSGPFEASTTVDTDVTFWNFANSHWEPLVEPWKFDVVVRKDGPTGALKTELSSQYRLDVNLTSTFLDQLLSTASVWSKESDPVLTKDRGADAPYRIINRTGATVNIWSEGDGVARKRDTSIVDGGYTSWRFDDWKTTRERVSSSCSNTIAVEFRGLSWMAIPGIPVDREGEFIYSLLPRTQEVADRLLIEVTAKDNVKIVTLRSTYKVENKTLCPIDVVLVDGEGQLGSSVTLDPGQDYAIPIEAVLAKNVKVRPHMHYSDSRWPEQPVIRWQDFLHSSSQTISCAVQDDDVPFYLQVCAVYNGPSPPARTYPEMSVILRAPMEIENMLLCDMRCAISGENPQKQVPNEISPGSILPVHHLHLGQLIRFTADISDSEVYNPSGPITINTKDCREPTGEATLRVAYQQGLQLNLGINYLLHEGSGGAFRMQLFSPFIAVNKTGFPITIRSAGGKNGPFEVGNAATSELTTFMFSHPEELGSKFTFRVDNSAWSDVLAFQAPSAEATVMLRPSLPRDSMLHHIGISWTPSLYALGKVVTFAPRYMIKNELPREILFRSLGDASSNTPLPPGGVAPVCFAVGHKPALALKYSAEADGEWTSPLDLQDIGTVHTRLITSNQLEPDLARAEVAKGSPTIWVTVKLEIASWPFRVENESDCAVEFWQTDSQQVNSPTKYIVQPSCQVPYTWDVPGRSDKKLRLKVGDSTCKVDIMKEGRLSPIRFRKRPSGYVSLDVRAAGQARILFISNYQEDGRSSKKPVRAGTTSSTTLQRDNSASQHQTRGVATTEAVPLISFAVDLAAIGLSLIDKRLVEVVRLVIADLTIEYTDSSVDQAVVMACGSIQVDNQLHEAIYPVLLRPIPLPRNEPPLGVQPILQMSVTILKDRSHGALLVKRGCLALQPLHIQVDEDVIYALIDLAERLGVADGTDQDHMLPKWPMDLLQPLLPPPSPEGGCLYFEALEVHPIRLTISFSRTERVNSSKQLILRNPLAVALNAFIMTIANTHDVPLRFNAVNIHGIRVTVPALQEQIFSHSKQTVLWHLPQILGSIDLIGNPFGFFMNVSSGLADMFYEPYRGVAEHGRGRFGVGIAKGVTSLAMKTTYSVTDSSTKFTRSIGKGLSAASFDRNYERERNRSLRTNRPENPISGVTTGARAMASSMWSGAEGVVTKPYEGARQGGILGLLKGIGRGLAGGIIKPAVGVLDLASNVTEGARNATMLERDARKRIPRHVPADGILRVYSQRKAIGQAYMKDLDNGKHPSDRYVSHIERDRGIIALLTTKRLVSFYATNFRLEWQVILSEVDTVDAEAGGFLIRNKRGRRYDQFLGIDHGGFKELFHRDIENVLRDLNASRRIKE